MRIIGLFLFAVLLLVIGVGCSLWPSQVIHMIYGRSRSIYPESFLDSKIAPKTSKEFMRTASEDPEMLNEKFPAAIIVIRLIGVMSMFMFLVLICGLWANG